MAKGAAIQKELYIINHEKKTATGHSAQMLFAMKTISHKPIAVT